MRTVPGRMGTTGILAHIAPSIGLYASWIHGVNGIPRDPANYLETEGVGEEMCMSGWGREDGVEWKWGEWSLGSGEDVEVYFPADRLHGTLH